MTRVHTPQVVEDGIPRVALRWDDGSFHQMEDAKWAVEYKIPHGFCINPSTIRSSGSLDRDEVTVSTRYTWDQLRNHIHRSERAGVPVSIIGHSRTNWTLHGTGAGEADAYTWAEILEELRKDDIEDLTGKPVSIYLQPGDQAAKDWCWGHRELIADALEAQGYSYATGLATSLPDNANGGMDGHGYGANDASYAFYNSTAPNNKLQVTPGLRPGLVRDPFMLPAGFTLDLGSTVVTRGVWTGSEVAPDPNSGADGWLLGRDNGRGSADGDPVADYNATWAFKCTRFLAQGLSFAIGLHGERRTNESVTVALDDGDVIRPGHFSVRHLLWTLRALEDAGYIRLVTYEDLLAHWLGRYANGVELTPRRDFGMPFHDIWDLSAGHVPYPAGLTTEMQGQSAFPSSTSQIFTNVLADGDGDQLFNDDVDLDTLIGPDVVGPRGKTGAVLLRADSVSNTHPSTLRLGWSHLTPGKYKFLLDVEDAGTGGRIRLAHLALIGARYLSDPERTLEDHLLGTDLGGIQFAPLLWEFEGHQLILTQNKQTTLKVEWELPENPTPWRGGKATWDIPSLAAVADLENVLTDTVTTADLANIPDTQTLDVDLTVTGAVAGQRPDVFTTTDLAGLTYTVPLCPAADTVRVTLHNDTGAGVDLGTTTWTVRVSGPTMAETDVTVTGARSGHRAVAIHEKDVGGLDLEAHVVDADTVRVTAINRTGSTVDPASGAVHVFTEWDPVSRTMAEGVSSRWSYLAQIIVAKDGLSQCKAANPRLFRFDL